MQAFYTRTQLHEIRNRRGESELQERLRTDRSTKHIRHVGQRLGLPYAPICTSLLLYHRFLARHSVHGFSEMHVILGCVSLSMKAEETVKKLRDIVIAAHFVVLKQESFDPDPKTLNEYRDFVMNIERMVLEDMYFDLNIHHPFRFALAYIKLLEGLHLLISGPQEVGERCWRLIKDIFSCTLCIQYPTHVLAISATIMAYRLVSIDMPLNLRDVDFLEKHSCTPKLLTGTLTSFRMSGSNEFTNIYFFKIR